MSKDARDKPTLPETDTPAISHVETPAISQAETPAIDAAAASAAAMPAAEAPIPSASFWIGPVRRQPSPPLDQQYSFSSYMIRMKRPF